MAKEAVERSLDAAWRACFPVPLNKTELWREFCRRRHVADNRYTRELYWPALKTYWEGKQDGPFNRTPSAIRASQGQLF